MNSSQANLDLLAARVQKLEASNRHWRLVNALLLLSGVSVVLMGAKPADRLEPPVVRAGTVEAQAFILRNETGHVYARLSLNPSTPRIKQSNGRTYFVPSDSLRFQASPRFSSSMTKATWSGPCPRSRC